MTHQELYQEKLRTLDQVLLSIRSGETICTGTELSEPEEFLRNLHKVILNVEDVELIKGKKGDGSGYPFMFLPELPGHLHLVSFLFDAAIRKMYQTGTASYLPANLHNVLAVRAQWKPLDKFVAVATPMDEDGFFHVSGSGMWEYDAYQYAKSVILEVNPNLPKFHGALKIPVERVEAVYEVDYPIQEFVYGEPTEIEKTIGGYAADFIHDGSCIQLGLGGTPNAVGNSFFDKHDLGIHTELYTPIMGDLIEAGVITGARKNIDRGQHVGNFVLGDQRFYRILAGNENVVFHPASYTNDPKIIAQNDNMVSLNTAVEIDLTGQICSETMGHRHYSGTGGATDFAEGAFHSKGGRGIIAMSSTAKGGTLSKIKATLTPGAAVSISRNLADVIITEYGVAYMKGRTVRERANQLIAIAHPAFREELRAQARELMYL